MRGRGECSVRQRKRSNGGSYWEARASINGRQVSFYAPSKIAALTKARQARADSERGVQVFTPTVTVGVYLETWLETIRPTVRSTTLQTYGIAVHRHISPAIGHIRLSQLTPSHVDGMLAGLVTAGLSDVSARHIRSILTTALTAAERDLGLSRNVARLARAPKTSAAPFSPERLTVEDVRRVIAAVAGDRCEPAVLFSIATGVRHGELLALHHEDIDGRTVTIRHSLDRHGVVSRTKTAAGARVLALSDLALGALALESTWRAREREVAGARWCETGVVFASRTGQHSAPRVASEHLRVCLERAALPPIRWHALRRCFAALLLDQGVPLHRIRDLLGHAHVQVTEHYAYTMTDALARDMGAVDHAL